MPNISDLKLSPRKWQEGDGGQKWDCLHVFACCTSGGITFEVRCVSLHEHTVDGCGAGEAIADLLGCMRKAC